MITMMSHRMLSAALFILGSACCMFSCLAGTGWAQQCSQFTFFEQTHYPLRTYFVSGDREGPTVMVQGGIQGDEEAGYLTAQFLVRSQVDKGNLIVVPRANTPSIMHRQRSVNVDLNRRFDQDYNRFYEDRLARAIKFLVGQADGLIHLHEGSGYYNPVYINSLRNPHRYGQSFIIDTAVYQEKIDLAQMVKDVLPSLNKDIDSRDLHFQLFNTQTNSPETKYPEQRKSLTFHALTNLNIPAVAIELSKNIQDTAWKVRHQLLACQELLHRFGIEIRVDDVLQDVPRVLARSQAKHGNPRLEVDGETFAPGTEVALRINSEMQVVCEDSAYLQTVQPQLGLFLSNEYSVNLIKNNYPILNTANQLELKADGEKIASWPVQNQAIWVPPIFLDKPIFVCSLNDELHFIPSGSELSAVQGDRLVLLGVWQGQSDEILNLKGYVSNIRDNDGQDLGHEILLDKDVFISRYLLKTSRQDQWRCEIVRETPGQPETRFTIRVHPREIRAMHLKNGQGDRLLLPFVNAESYALPPGRYTLEKIACTGDPDMVLPVVDSRPLQLSKTFYIPSDRTKTLSLYQSTNFKLLGSTQFKGAISN